jgi:hypothetical protein
MSNVVRISSDPNSQEDYRKLIKQTLEVEDYEEVLLAIMDLEYYDALDEELQGIVSAYFSFEG